MLLKDYVLRKIDPDTYYEARFRSWNSKVRGNVCCVFHADKSPSLALSLKNGGAKCHASSCGKSIGNIVHFESERLKLPEKVVVKRLYTEFIRPIISKKDICQYREALTKRGDILLKIQKEMGISASTQRLFAIGLDEVSNRITIPVYDEFGHCINIRYYRLPSTRTQADSAKIYNRKGFGGIDLFPAHQWIGYNNKRPIVFLAAEKEVMIACQAGLQAICSTAGEGSYNPEWDSFFDDKNVIVVLNTDSAGKKASEVIGQRLATVANSVQCVTLPFREKRKDRNDFADWVLREKNNPKDVLKLVKKRTKEKVKPNKSITNNDLISIPELHTTEIQEIVAIASRPDLLNCKIQVQGIVGASSSIKFSIPWKFRIKVKSRDAFTYALPVGRDLIQFVRLSDDAIHFALEKLLGGKIESVEPLDYINATEVEIIPIAVTDRDVPYTVQRCYYIGSRIESNVPYLLDVIPVAEIKTQQNVGVITDFIPLSRSTDRFDMTPEMYAELCAFQPEGEETVWDKLASVAKLVSENVTHIYNRTDWHMVALLTWASPIGWRMPDEKDIQRGWLNSLALGDTQTGKSKVCEALQKLFKCGVFVNSENCTYVGLVGGAIKTGNGQLMLRWGRIPLSDKQLVVLEELSGLSVEEISHMSDVRSSGIARLDKGGINAETNARTRLLCLSNARGRNKSVSQYLYGVKAIEELIGHGEDIARFDLITTLIDREVDTEIINSRRIATVAIERPIPNDSFKHLIHFIWSLTPDKIHITEKAYDECLKQTKKLSAMYHPHIPIFKGGSGRYKLARIAAAIACLQFSEYNGGIKVTGAHVKVAAKLLKFIYDKQSFGYKQYSDQMFDRETVSDTETMERTIKERIPPEVLPKVMESLIHATKFTQDELCAVGGLTTLYAAQIIGTMLRSRVLRKGDANIWEITPVGKTFLERFLPRTKPKPKTKQHYV